LNTGVELSRFGRANLATCLSMIFIEEEV